MPPQRVQSSPRLVEKIEQDPGIQMTLRHGMSPVLEGIEEVVDSYKKALSRQSYSRYKLPVVEMPKYKTRGDWYYFVAYFKDIMRLANLKLSHQQGHLKQAVPEVAKCLLYQQDEESVEHALEILTEFYEPLKDGLAHSHGKNSKNFPAA